MKDQITKIKNELYSHIAIIRQSYMIDGFENFSTYIVDITNKYQDIIDYLSRIVLSSVNFFRDVPKDARMKYKIMHINGRDVVLPNGLYEKIDAYLNELLSNIIELNPNNIVKLDEHRAANLNHIQIYLTQLDQIETSLYDFFHSIVDYKSDKTLPSDSLEKQLNHYYKKFEELSKNFYELESNFNRSSSSVNKVYQDITDLNQRISELTATFLKAKNNYENNSIEVINSIKDAFSEKTGEVIHKFISDIDETYNIIDEEINDIKETSKKFNEFISEETSIKLTNNFKAKSEIERNWYYGFNATSAIIIGIAIWMSYTSLTGFAEKHATDFTQLDLYYLGIRLLFSFLIFSTVTFTNKLANKHYYHWKKNESTYLKLTALKSFIADMSLEKQQEIHEKLIDVYFGKEDLDPTIYKKYDSSRDSLIKAFADKLPNIGVEPKKGN